MARGELTPQEIEIRKVISQNINRQISAQGLTQVEISKHTNIPKSTLTGYVKGTSTPNAGNVQKLADFFGIRKSEIDPRFSTKTSLPLNSQEEEIVTLFRKNTEGMSSSDKERFNTSLESLMKTAKKLLSDD